MELFAPIIKDAYKIGHKDQYAEGTEVVYSNLTARSGTHSNVKGSTGVIFIGLQFVIKNILIDTWNNTFFFKPKDEVVALYQEYVSHALGYTVSVEHIAELHELGYLPIEIRALPEGSFVPYKVPMLTIHNTLPDFYWVTNMLETMISAETWGMITSATTYNAYYETFKYYAGLTGGGEGIRFQAHDFSMRGMNGCHGAAMSGFAALAAGSLGTDTLVALQIAKDYYGADLQKEVVGCSVNATEHSVMCSNSKEGELDTFRRLLTEIYPHGILSIVSDTWDFWEVVTGFLPKLKEDILAREGKVVIRPDSGDPVDILCGTCGPWQAQYDGHETMLPEEKGLIECLWETFGGTINSHGFKVLDDHIGAIYGDAITLERQDVILGKLEARGFCSSNIVLGVGSYSYQMVSRDTHGMAIKATYVEIDGEGVEIFKDPKTDDGVKKSAKGLLQVQSYADGSLLQLTDQVTRTEAETGALKTVFKNGDLLIETTLQKVRDRVEQTCGGI